MFTFLNSIFSDTSLPDDEPIDAQLKDFEKDGFTQEMRQFGLVGASCDKLKQGHGSFGIVSTNPIPVNGLRGTYAYLNRLVIQKPSGNIHFMFHKIGQLKVPSIKGLVDHYELVSFDSSLRIHLYLHLYHPRRSRLAPDGLVLLPWSQLSNIEKTLFKVNGLGAYSTVADFPFGLLKELDQTFSDPSLQDLKETFKRILESALIKNRSNWGKSEPEWFTAKFPTNETQPSLTHNQSASHLNDIGVKYYEGDGVPRDYAKAAEYYTKATEQGLAEAQSNLGKLLYHGLGVAQDLRKAAECFMKAAQQGDTQGQLMIAMMYDCGEGVPQDRTQAAIWYTEAAEKNVAVAQERLGIMYANGIGVPKNYILSYHWISLAAAQSMTTSREYLNDLEKVMSKEQIAEAQKTSAITFDRIKRG